MKDTATESRRLVLELLLEQERSGRKYSELLHSLLNKYDHLPRQEKAFIRRLSSGVIERRITLDYIIDRFASIKTKKQKLPVKLILRMGVYQLLYMDGVPASAAVNEAVKLACDKGFYNLKGFVNAVLRSVDREREAIVWPDRSADTAEYLSVKYSMPRWIVEKLMEECGEEACERQLAAYLSERPVSVQVIRNEDELLAEWERQGVSFTGNPYLPHMFFLSRLSGVEELYGFSEGDFFVQDTSSALAVYAAGIRPGEKLLDICAAPGGKSLLAATLCGDCGHVSACDISEEKLERISENIKRLGIKNISTKLSDARCENAEFIGSADVLLADLPCSGLGVLGRKADIRYRIESGDIGALSALQKEILRASMSYLKPGGRLLYSTCTVSRQENSEIRSWLMSEFDMEPVDISTRLHAELLRGDMQCGEAQLYCGEPEGQPLLDGFYFCLLKRRGA